jgi:hypothetical protein
MHIIVTHLLYRPGPRIEARKLWGPDSTVKRGPLRQSPVEGELWARRHNCRAQGVRPVGAPGMTSYC